MESISHSLRNMIVKIMSDGKERSLAEIKEAVQDEGWTYDMDYSEGHLAGTMRILRTSGQLEQMARGRYRLGGGASETSGNVPVPIRLRTGSEFLILKKEVLSDLEEQYNRLVQRLSTRTLSSLDPKEFEYVKELLELKKDLEKILKKNH